MKDEEMAEEYAKDNCERWESDCLTVDDIAKENFLAGLKAGRPQWHDLREDPNDLPKEHKLYLCAIKSNGNSICYFNGLHWENKYSMGDFGHCVETVIAWCEIPTFDKE